MAYKTETDMRRLKGIISTSGNDINNAMLVEKNKRKKSDKQRENKTKVNIFNLKASLKTKKTDKEGKFISTIISLQVHPRVKVPNLKFVGTKYYAKLFTVETVSI